MSEQIDKSLELLRQLKESERRAYQAARLAKLIALAGPILADE